VGRARLTRAKLGPLLDAPWPQVDPAALAQDEIELVLQINGKLRGKLTVPPRPTTQRSKRPRARAPRSRRFDRRKRVKRVIVVPGKLVNVVV
jgi:leucyl-tRNA synthetase